MASEVLKKGGEVASEVLGETRSFDFEGMRFGVKVWRASASDARESGSPTVPIVLVHGFAQQASTWDDVARLLAERFPGETPEIELVGLCTDICVLSNALLLRAAFPNAPITVDARCCAGVTEDAHRAALTAMQSCQIDILAP